MAVVKPDAFVSSAPSFLSTSAREARETAPLSERGASGVPNGSDALSPPESTRDVAAEPDAHGRAGADDDGCEVTIAAAVRPIFLQSWRAQKARADEAYLRGGRWRDKARAVVCAELIADALAAEAREARP
ncbi:MAG: hypothetical protein NW215_10575 [Hyphomicrobiales bacterium]|nr:hypothetical protein [Hyphomicrobiales bacterium]